MPPSMPLLHARVNKAWGTMHQAATHSMLQTLMLPTCCASAPPCMVGCKCSALQERDRLQTLTEPRRAAPMRTRARKKDPRTTTSTNSDLQQRVRPWLQPLRAARPRTAQLPAPTSRLRSSASFKNCARSAHPRLGPRDYGAAQHDFKHRPVARAHQPAAQLGVLQELRAQRSPT